VTELASVTYRKEKMVGMRFSIPVGGVLEIIRGQKTSDETVAVCAAAGRRMGRNVVVIEEALSNER
jgi:enoyl-CoA hydratase/3-hydroxyacyl-CoA dehydrogenase